LEWSVEKDNVQVSWAPTWSLMNANYYIETCNWWLNLVDEMLEDRNWGLVKTNFIYGPPWYQMSLLSNKDELKQKALDYIEELKNSSIYGVEHIIDMTEAYIKFFDKDDSKSESNLNKYYKMTDTLDEIRGQSLKKMIPLTYDAMYTQRKKTK
jgi:hypothetical protein